MTIIQLPSAGRRPVVDVDPLAWRADALCAQTDPEMFMPDIGGDSRPARKVCAACDVREECLEYALDNGENLGVWGGLSARQRSKLRRSNERAAA